MFFTRFHEAHCSIVILSFNSTNETLEGSNFGENGLGVFGMSKKLVGKFILSFSNSVEDGIFLGSIEFRNHSRERDELVVDELFL